MLSDNLCKEILDTIRNVCLSERPTQILFIAAVVTSPKSRHTSVSVWVGKREPPATASLSALITAAPMYLPAINPGERLRGLGKYGKQHRKRGIHAY